MQNLNTLFQPRGIAIIGASAEASRPGGQTVAALQQRGYTGAIYPVNPKYPEIAGLKSYASIDDVPDPCDAAVIALPAAHVPAMVAACGKRGVRLAVILGGGFRESGPEGQQLEAALRQTALEHGVRLIGPNCLGFVNVPDKVYAGFGSLVRPPLVSPGAVSAVIQSGGFGNSLVMRCGAAGIGFRYVIASGNETDVTAAQCIDAFVDDPQTKIILAYIEGVTDGPAFMHAARRALAARKPVLIWKAGNTRQGLQAAASHTANMTGSYDVFKAAFRQCGIIEIHDMDDSVDYIRALLSEHPKVGRRVAVMGGSGGSAVVFSDGADQHGLTLATLAPETRRVLGECLPGVASLENPIDFAAGFLTPANETRFARALDAVLADPGIDQLGLMLATVVGAAGATAARVLAQAAERHHKPIMVFWAAPRDSVGDAYPVLEQAGIPVMASPKRVAAAMGMLADYSDALAHAARDAATDVTGTIAAADPAALSHAAGLNGALDEQQSKQLIAAFGVPVTRDQMFAAEPIKADQASGLPYPVALKILSPDIAHKSDVGGVRLNLNDAQALNDASRGILRDVAAKVPDARLTGLLACQMVTGGMEAIVGVVNDASFGPVVALGMGGIFAEAMNDMTYRVAPFDRETALAMIGELRSASMFGPMRGRPARDVDALADALAAVSRLAWSLRDRLRELDINPLLVMPQGEGVIAVDALIVLDQPASQA